MNAFEFSVWTYNESIMHLGDIADRSRDAEHRASTLEHIARLEAEKRHLIDGWNAGHYFSAIDKNGELLHVYGTLEDAIENAETRSQIAAIEEIGGNWDTYRKCGFCYEWTPETELDEDDICTYCLQAIKSHR